MKLTATDLRYLHAQACIAAEQAGSLIRQARVQDVAVEHKDGGDSAAAQVVTEVDRQCQTAIFETLASTQSQFDLACLSEEQDDDRQRLHTEYFWCIDPLDGTLAFTENTPGYAVSIALVSRSGEPVLGVVHDPVAELTYSAIHGQGANRDHTPWPGSSDDSFRARPLTVPVDRSFQSRQDFDGIIAQLDARARQVGFSGLHLIRHGGAVMNAIRVLEQPPGLYFKMPKPALGGGSVWDFAATACLFRESGAIVHAFKGGALNFNRADTTFMNDCGVVYASHQKLTGLLDFLDI